MQKISAQNPKFYYYVSGDNPKLLIHSGTHGDEYEVTDFVTEAILKYEKQLPSFIYVPAVSPSAVERKTRRNENGNDMNRSFFSDSSDPEVQTNIKIINGHKFDMFVSFHEDWEFSDYYVYDWGYGREENELVLKHNQLLKSKGIGLFNGIDDPRDLSLGYKFVDGYNKFAHIQKDTDDGIISDWILNRKISKEYLLPETPQKLGRESKRTIVDTFFTEVILKSFAK